MSKRIGAIASGVIIIGCIIYGALSITKIPAGYVGVQYSSFGGIKNKVLKPGWHFTSPTIKVTKYSVATETLLMTADKREGSEEDESFNVSCRDGEMKVDFEMQYNFEEDRVTDVFAKYKGIKGETVVSENLRGRIRSIVNEVLSNYSVLEAYLEKKADVNKELTLKMREVLGEYGIYVESASIPDAKISEKVADAIDERTQKSQQLESAKIDQEKVLIASETKIREAEGAAKAEIARANGEAEANRIKSQSITDNILKARMLEKWDGKLPTVSGNGQNILDVNSLIK